MTRTNAREIAAHLVYEMEFSDEPVEQLVQARLDADYYPSLKDEDDIYADQPNEKQAEYIRQTVRGIREKQEELNGFIQKYAIGWDLKRISRVAKAIMLVAMYESLYVDDVPTNAAISEAVELTRKYENEDVVSFVNGILGSFAREVTAQ